MADFFIVSARPTKRGTVEVYPRFVIKQSSDLMIRGGDFYAVWIEERSLWSTNEQDAIHLIDRELDIYAEEHRDQIEGSIHVLHLWDAESGMIDRWHKYVQKQMRDNFHMLDEKLVFANTDVSKEDYASKRLPYPLERCDISSYERLMSVLYSEEERKKIEWAIGAVISGESRSLQKFMVLYGAAGTGKSTVLGIIEQLFAGYYSVFDAKALGSSNNAFALEAFKSNPLVAIQHDGDLSRIEDNTRLNSLVSHEMMTVNEKFRSAYSNKFKAFLFMGTNKPVKITDAKSGLIRRLIDVSPSGNKLSASEYKSVMRHIPFELGGIACHCLDVFNSDPSAYDTYIPVSMLGASNDFYNFVLDSYFVFKKEDGITMARAWEMYKHYNEEAKVPFPYPQRIFKEELKNYFLDYKERYTMPDGDRVRSYYIGFKNDIFDGTDSMAGSQKPEEKTSWLSFGQQSSLFDTYCSDCPAQYASDSGTPLRKWENVDTRLSDIDTGKLHYVKLPENHIVVDFDIPGEDGKKSLAKNLETAGKFPPTYGEVSKSGAGIHLHYIYTGDPKSLSHIYEDHIEIKVFLGNSSLRRMLTKCNDIPIAKIGSGLPLKGDGKVVNWDGVKSEKILRTMIRRNLNKEYHGATKPSVDYIHKLLEDAYNSGLCYDVTDLRSAVLSFAAGSTNNADYCIKLVNKMRFRSEEASENTESDSTLIFYDVEVFPNLFVVNWKAQGEDKKVVRMINPKPAEIEELLKFRLVGFNCRRYDNHILYAALMGYGNEQLFKLSQKIVSGKSDCFFGEAYNISYTDVYDFASSGNKKSLKKLEIEMGTASEQELKKKGFSDSEIRIIKAGTHHQELGLPWDKPVPEELWTRVAEYCDNDVIATEAAFVYLKADWTAREILADIAGATVNDTTNSLTQKIIFGNNRKPQDSFNYRNLAEPVHYLDEEICTFLKEACPEMMSRTHGEEGSLLPYFPGYRFEGGKSTYCGEEVGEGGYVYAEPGIYVDVALLDIASMHPHSVIAEVLFGVKFTKAFREIVEGRVSIKHEAWDTVNTILNGKLTPYIQKVTGGEMTSKQLADALKTAINSVYGLTSASFDNPFRDKRNVDNIVAKRGALFMINLKHEVQKRGFTVAHIKTDSIKIPNATPEIIKFVAEYGKAYGYSFEHEATYDRMCLVNDAVYIARYKDGKHAGEWTPTGTQFAVPYVFKKLFSREEITFDDLCETKSVISATSALYLDMNEGLPEGEHDYHFIGKVGRFCPIKEGCGGGVLLREKDGKYYAATGTKGYRWLESEMVRSLSKENDIDRSYYGKLVDEAYEAISNYGDLEWFVS